MGYGIQSGCMLTEIRFLFYPTLVYAYIDYRQGREVVDEERTAAGTASDERTALLRD